MRHRHASFSLGVLFLTAQMVAVEATIPASSLTSPANVTITANSIPTIGSLVPESLGGGRWTVDIPLDAEQPVPVSISAAQRTASGTIAWSVLDLADLPAVSLDIRVGDQLRIHAPAGAEIITPNGSMFLAPASTAIVPCSVPGVSSVQVSGSTVLTLNVLGLPFAPGSITGRSLYAQKDKTVPFTLPDHPMLAKVHFGTSESAKTLVVSRPSTNVIGIKALTFNPAILTLRVGSATGPVITTVPVQGYTLSRVREFAANPPTALRPELEVFRKNSAYARTLPPEEIGVVVRLTPWLPDAQVLATRFAHSATFIGGTSTFTMPTDGQPSSLGEPGMVQKQVGAVTVGEFTYAVFKPRHEKSTCVRVQLQQILPPFEPLTPTSAN